MRRNCDSPFISLLGVRINMVDYDSTLSIIRDCIEQHSCGDYICACPVHPIMVCQKDQELRDALNNSVLTVPDGLPVVWASRLLGGSIHDRVYGPNLMLRSCELAERMGYSVFLYGSKPETLKMLEEKLFIRFPRLHIIGKYSPPFRKLLAEEEKEILDIINSARPDILFVGLGAPKQEKWMASFCSMTKIPVSIGVGAAFDFLSGEKRQAPSWMQSVGMEWLFRLISEPRRLWRRYLVYNPLFILYLLKQVLYTRSKTIEF